MSGVIVAMRRTLLSCTSLARDGLIAVGAAAGLSAGPAERAIRASSFERARDAITGSITQYRTAAGTYHLNNTFRYLIARA